MPPDEVSDENGIYLIAFNDLSTCRQLSDSGAGPIPVDRIWNWCDRYSYDSEQAEIMMQVLTAMDSVYMKHQAKKAKKSTAKRPIGTSARRPRAVGRRR